jgi:uncharacterized LabA/DUF88 family protein
MRVMMFFDGPVYVEALARSLTRGVVDYGRLAQWALASVDGTQLAGAHYYTGAPGAHEAPERRQLLSELIDIMECEPGFFVHRFNRSATRIPCAHCGENTTTVEEKMLHTALVTDVVMLGVQDAYDVAVLFTNDVNVIPGVQAIQTLGKRAWVVSCEPHGVSRSLARASWSTLQLSEGLAHSSHVITEIEVAETSTPLDGDVDQEMVRELERAVAHFGQGGGFVGAHYFIHRWKGHQIPDTPDERRKSIQRLVDAGRAEAYSVDGKAALRPLPAHVTQVSA